MAYETLLIEKEGSVAIVKLNRPPVNSLSVKSYEEICDLFAQLAKDESVGAIVVTGAGDKAFGAGLDVKDVAGKSVTGCLEFTKQSRVAMEVIQNIEKPTVAAVFGFTLGGGCEVALACDLRIAATDAVLGLPEITLGIMPGSGGTQRLPRLIGVARAKELLFTGDTVNAEEAYRIGLVNRVVAREKLMEEAMALAKKLASRPRVAMGLIKSAINTGMSMDLSSGISLELESFAIAYSSEDGREGLQAFSEKRKPIFKGK
jgi:enoyl-CoA hydratase